MVYLVIAYGVIDRFSIKIASEVNKEFTLKAKVKQVVLKFIIVDGVDKVDESDRVNKHKEIALS